MAKPLKSLFFHPLLLTLVAKHLVFDGDAPAKLEDIFQSWLATLVDSPSRRPAARVKLARALRLLALATEERPISIDEALGILDRNGLPEPVFDDMVQSDAVALGATTIELQHESLADYLRAEHIASTEETFADYLRQTEKFKDSLLPILLMGMLRTRLRQRALWTKLQNMSLDAYLNALRFRADIGQEFSSGDQQLAAEQFLEDLLDGFEGPLNSFFPQMRDIVVANLTCGGVGLLGIRGFLDSARQVIGYQFISLDVGKARVVVGDPRPSDGQVSWMNLTRCGLRLDSGRLLGALRLRDALLSVVESRQLLGGKAWVTERLLSRVRFLEGVYWRMRPRSHNLAALAEALQTMGDGDGRISVAELVPWIPSMIGDVKMLRAEGEKFLHPWWLPNVDPARLIPISDEQHYRLLDEHFRRTLQVYADVCEQSLSNFLDHLSYVVAPIRWQLDLDRKGFFGTTMYFKWRPVRNWSEAGADVRFVEARPERTGEEERAVFEELQVLGRPTDRHMFGVGFTQVPAFDGRTFHGSFDGETSVLRDVCGFIADDIKALFFSLPDRDC
jgi:hypothetical protein